MGGYLSTLLLYIWYFICVAVNGNDFVQLTLCSAKVDGKVINLESIKNSLSVQFGEGTDQWNYTYNPCNKFSKPLRANEGFGDKCLAVAVELQKIASETCEGDKTCQHSSYHNLQNEFFICLCKYGKQDRREYYYTLGFHNDANFIVEKRDNKSSILISYNGFRSMNGKNTYIRLVCDRERNQPEDAFFTILKDMKGLGNVYAELHHVSCCPDGYLSILQDNVHHDDQTDQNVESVNQTDQNVYQLTTNGTGTAILSNSTSPGAAILPEKKDDKVETDRTKVMIIVGVNVGVIFMAGFIGFMCYNKRSHTEFYSKLPGVRTVPNATLWQLADVEEANTGPISSTLSSDRPVPSSAKSDFRDGAPSNKRKSVCFPILEHCGIPEDCLSLGQRLGGSIFSDTYIAEWSGITVSIKRLTLTIHKYQIDKENIGELKSQVSFLSKQRHRNIVALLGYCSESTHPYIISECITGQILKDFIKSAREQLTWPHRVKILSQIADGMAFLHSTQPPILHRDLRCGNLFITNNDVVKICDFGIVNITQSLRAGCQLEDCGCQGLYSACPPWIGWTAPEVLEHPTSQECEGYITKAADVYSYAVVMWELVMCDDPYEDMNTAQEVIDYVISGGRPEIPGEIKMLRSYKMLMNRCWDGNMDERLSFKQITVQLKEILQQAKIFHKDLNQRGNRERTSSKTLQVSFSENNAKT